MPSPADFNTSSDPEILAARGKVELAKAELESRIYQAGDSGKRALTRMARKATPIVIVAAAVGIGTLLVVRLLRARRSRAGAWRTPVRVQGESSLVKVALGAALRAAVRVLAARAVEQAAARLVENEPSDDHELGPRDLDEHSVIAQ